MKNKIIKLGISLLFLIIGYHVLRETVFLSENTKIERIKNKVAEAETNLESTHKERTHTLISELYVKKRAGLITYAELDQTIRDSQRKEAEYPFLLAEKLSAEYNLSKGATIALQMQLASKGMEKVVERLNRGDSNAPSQAK